MAASLQAHEVFVSCSLYAHQAYVLYNLCAHLTSFLQFYMPIVPMFSVSFLGHKDAAEQYKHHQSKLL